jgi:DNA-binding SARP family transcriptional activator
MLGTRGRSGLAVLVAGDWPAARATLRLHDDGLVEVTPLGLTVQSNRLPADVSHILADLLGSARAAPPHPDPSQHETRDSEPRHQAEEPDPDPVVPHTTAVGIRHVDPRPHRIDSSPPADLSDADPKTVTVLPAEQSDELDAAVAAYLDETVTTIVRVGILGPVQVTANGPIETKRVNVCTELITYLATHGRRIDKPAELDLALWPDRSVQLSTRTEAIARARRWLGADAAGNAHLPHGHGGELRLGPDVLLDWDLFQGLASRGMAKGPGGKRDLATALRLVRGKPFENTPAGRYRWLAETFLEQDIPAAVVDVAHHLARLCLDGDDPAGARDAARTAHKVDRYDERPWRDLLEAEHAMGNRGQVRALVDELMTVLEIEIDDELTEETRDLIQQISRGQDSDSGSNRRERQAGGG